MKVQHFEAEVHPQKRLKAEDNVYKNPCEELDPSQGLSGCRQCKPGNVLIWNSLCYYILP
jgi:hypothetical protein